MNEDASGVIIALIAERDALREEVARLRTTLGDIAGFAMCPGNASLAEVISRAEAIIRTANAMTGGAKGVLEAVTSAPANSTGES